MKMKIAGLCTAILFGASGLAFAQDAAAPPVAPPAATQQAAPPAEAAAPATEQAAPAAPSQGAEQAVAQAPAPTLPSGISAPPEGKGQVVFFRPSRFVGAALSFTVRENETPLGRLPNGRYFVHVAEPGIHEYEIGNNDTMRMEIEPGETYYAIQSTQMGIVAGRAVLSPSDQAAFEAAAARMRVSAPVEK
jgi:hypothetical protein